MIDLGSYPLTFNYAKSQCVSFDSHAQSFSAGRYCAQIALLSNGYNRPEEVLLQDERGGPLWPKGYVGSITHTGGFAAAMVVKHSMILGLGIDSEILIPQGRAEAILSEIVSASEWTRLQETCSELTFERLAILCFSAKESVYKCMSPLLRKTFGFHSVEITQIDLSQRAFQARLLTGASPFIEGKYAFAETMVHTLAWVESSFE